MKVDIIQMSDLHIASANAYIVNEVRCIARSVSFVLKTYQKVAFVITCSYIESILPEKGIVNNSQNLNYLNLSHSFGKHRVTLVLSD